MRAEIHRNTKSAFSREKVYWAQGIRDDTRIISEMFVSMAMQLWQFIPRIPGKKGKLSWNNNSRDEDNKISSARSIFHSSLSPHQIKLFITLATQISKKKGQNFSIHIRSTRTASRSAATSFARLNLERVEVCRTVSLSLSRLHESQHSLPGTNESSPEEWHVRATS